MAGEPLNVDVTSEGIAILTLDRPEVRNAFDDRLIAALAEAFARLDADASLRAVVLQASGPHFSAGADLGWMRRMGENSEAENRDDALALAAMLRALDTLRHPVIARVQGAALAGATGLVACCDVAVAAEDALFGTTEVRLGIIPATIGPYVLRAIGVRAARRFFLTGERFGAVEALRLGLVHEVVPGTGLDDAVARVIAGLRAGGPLAVRHAKALIPEIAGRPVDDALLRETAERIAALRATPEAREGLTAFLEKRKPAWAAD